MLVLNETNRVKTNKNCKALSIYRLPECFTIEMV